MKRVLFVFVALLIVVALSLVIKPSEETEHVVLRVHKNPVIFNVY